jgi:hypothetical protein
LGVEPDYLGWADFRSYIGKKIAGWTQVVKKGSIKLQ